MNGRGWAGDGNGAPPSAAPRMVRTMAIPERRSMIAESSDCATHWARCGEVSRSQIAASSASPLPRHSGRESCVTLVASRTSFAPRAAIRLPSPRKARNNTISASPGNSELSSLCSGGARNGAGWVGALSVNSIGGTASMSARASRLSATRPGTRWQGWTISPARTRAWARLRPKIPASLPGRSPVASIQIRRPTPIASPSRMALWRQRGQIRRTV